MPVCRMLYVLCWSLEASHLTHLQSHSLKIKQGRPTWHHTGSPCPFSFSFSAPFSLLLLSSKCVLSWWLWAILQQTSNLLAVSVPKGTLLLLKYTLIHEYFALGSGPNYLRCTSTEAAPPTYSKYCVLCVFFCCCKKKPIDVFYNSAGCLRLAGFRGNFSGRCPCR